MATRNWAWKPEKRPRTSKGFIRTDTVDGWEVAFTAGRRAFQRGILRIDNPMLERSLRHQWYDGWDAASREAVANA